ncbi:MAG: GTPase [Planctomycetaceae bacterium]
MPATTAHTPAATGPFAACAALVRQLADSLEALERSATLMQLPPLAGREWYELLRRKLVPQLVQEPFLVAAVVGGTNIGKSVIFNHLAGFQASGVSPLASGTKHPVCLIPPGFEQRHDLGEIFAGFELAAWEGADAALAGSEQHRLFWKVASQLPPNLLVLDTPDIDSDAPVNWHRADCIRHCADVLIAVLTQQKYNDAAVKQFFRKAAAEDKCVICIFNQCLLPEDEPYWPRWLETFSDGTGITPDLVYIAPTDRAAADRLKLPFFQRDWPPDDAAESHGRRRGAAPDGEPRSLAEDLSDLHFLDVKLRTLRGSLAHVLSAENGAPAYLEELRRRSAGFADAARLLSAQELARIDNWPAPPPRLLVDEVRRWWRTQRQGWTRTIHDAYGKLGQGLLWPIRFSRERISGPTPDPRAAYRQSELDVMLQALDTLYRELQRLAELGNDLLRPRLEKLLAGATRAQLLERLHRQHAALDLNGELESVVAAQMRAFRDERPGIFSRLKRLDELAALARPVTSVVLFAAAGPVGHALTPAVTDAAAQSLVVHILGDIAGGTGAVVMGETALSGTAEGLRWLETWFQNLQTAFTRRRVAWFADFLRENVLGTLHQDLQTAAIMPESEAFQNALACLDRLNGQVGA